MSGSQYAVSEVDPSIDSLTGGPTKQELAWTDPGILNMEFLSDHYGIDGGKTGFPGYAYTPPQGVASSRLFGPFAFRVATDTTRKPQHRSIRMQSIQFQMTSFFTRQILLYLPTDTCQMRAE